MNPHFDNPPVVERVIGIQFDALPFFTNAHVGWFWKSFLKDPAWSHLSNAPKITDKFEIFGDKKIADSSALFQIVTSPIPDRSQIVRESDERMLQLQNSRFVLNWRRKENLSYPDFDDLLDEFQQHYQVFKAFVKEAGQSEPKINQWEVIYVNQIPKGEIWSTAGDWLTLFPGLSLPGRMVTSMDLETIGVNWSVNLAGQIGRLHMSLRHAITNDQRKNEVAVLELTARGPATDFESFQIGLNSGHNAIVNTFAEITSEVAQIAWGRK